MSVGQLDLGVALDDAKVIAEPDRVETRREGGEGEKFSDGGQHRAVNLPRRRDAEPPDDEANGYREGDTEDDLALPALPVHPL